MRNLKIFLSILFVSVLFIGCGSDIDMVKDGVMNFNKTITVGEAFDNNVNCKKGEWESFETDNGTRVVQFTCNVKGVKEFFNKTKSFFKDKDDLSHLDIISNIKVYQFTINKDDTFQIDNVQNITKWADGKKTENPSDAVEALEEIYKNRLSLNIDELNDMLAGQISYAFMISKAKAK